VLLCVTTLIDLGEDRGWQAELDVKLMEVVGDPRVVVGVHDGDGRPAAVPRNGAIVETDLVEMGLARHW
jgi:hypothetical protein